MHTVTYLIFGILFMLLTDYFGVFARDPLLSAVMKPSDALSVRLAAPVQISDLAMSSLYLPVGMVLYGQLCK